MESKTIRKRNRRLTIERILKAVGDVIAEKGAERAGINAVAEKAGVNKVLIYRYFGGWEELLLHYIQERAFFTDFNNSFLENASAAATVKPGDMMVWADYLTQFMHEFRRRKPSQELLKWELFNQSSEICRQLSEVRRVSLQKLVDQLASDGEKDAMAVHAVLMAGVTFLVLLAPYCGNFYDLDFESEEGWQRLEKAIVQIYSSINSTTESR